MSIDRIVPRASWAVAVSARPSVSASAIANVFPIVISFANVGHLWIWQLPCRIEASRMRRFREDLAVARGLRGGDSAWQNATPWRTATMALAGPVAVESGIDEESRDQGCRDHGRLARHRHLEYPVLHFRNSYLRHAVALDDRDQLAGLRVEHAAAARAVAHRGAHHAGRPGHRQLAVGRLDLADDAAHHREPLAPGKRD